MSRGCPLKTETWRGVRCVMMSPEDWRRFVASGLAKKICGDWKNCPFYRAAHPK